TASNKAVKWSTSNAEVATVNASGKVTAIAEGTATIKVTTEDGKLEATSEVTVSPKDSSGENTPVTGVTLDKATLNLKVGESDELKATVTPDTASNKAVKWSTSNAEVATVNASGKVTAIAEGTATIKVTTEDGKFEATSEVTVTKLDTSGGDKDSKGSNPGTGSNGSGSNGSSGNTTPGNVVDNGSGANSSYKVSSADLNNSANGVTTVEVPAKTTEISLPGNTADLIKQNALQIKSDAITLTVPSELLKQLFSKLSTEEQQNSTVTLKLSPLSNETAVSIINGSSQTAHAGLKLSSDIYELTLSIQTASGQSINLSKFDQPITIQLKVAADTNPKLAGIFYISDGGSIEYVGGTYANGYMTAKLTHFSKYAVLEYTKSFVDVPAGHWAADVIKELAAKQLVNGTSDSTLEPERKVTRAEFTAMLIRALHLTDKGTLAFTDVKDGDWYAEAVAIAVKAGIVQGKTQTLFDANAQITREEMVTMLMRGYEVVHGQVTVNNPTSFTDEAKISAWAVPFVNAASANKLIQGRAAGKFDPKGITTRAEAAQVIYNLLNN
ncbi:S-layer homology domain-containing protein, partial [Paenibacillus sp. GCM10012306]|uniref:S-layer homology domain-containing protein n=1 Tax=Paenibacillus sp. GCM10012306 TaxID=3317342 RepID=UPI00361338F2